MNKNPVEEYYDKNTRRFLKLGHGSDARTIHRAVWAPGITDRNSALHYIHTLISGKIKEVLPEKVLDIGCGVGGTILYLADEHQIDFTGITLSSVQARIGNSYIGRNSRSRRLRILQGDFCSPALRGALNERFGLLFALEAFLHMPEPAAFFSNAGQLTKQDGLLIIADDFLTPRGLETPAAGKDRRMIEYFRKGWHAHSLIDIDTLITSARQYGFSPLGNTDLTPYLELDRPRDRLLRAAAAAVCRLPYSSPFLSNIVGGNALQYCLKNGLIEHRFITLKKSLPGL